MNYEKLERKKLLGYYHYKYKNGWWTISDLTKESSISNRQLHNRIGDLNNKTGNFFTLEQAVMRPAKPRKTNHYVIDDDLFFELNNLWAAGSLSNTVR